MAGKSAKQAAKQRVKKVVKKAIVSGIVTIKASFNNTYVTVADENGNVIARNSAGQQGFKGSRKSTPFAAQVAAAQACKGAKEVAPNLNRVDVKVVGPGPGRESAARAVSTVFQINNLIDATPVPHNGCRSPKQRRV